VFLLFWEWASVLQYQKLKRRLQQHLQMSLLKIEYRFHVVQI
jgi:hypothetical protein